MYVWFTSLHHLCDVQDHLHETDLQELQEVHCVVDSTPVADYLTEFQEFAEYLMEEDGLEPPSNPTEALNLYTYLLKKNREMLTLKTLYKTN